MSTTPMFLVATLGSCALGLSACAATESAPSNVTSAKPSPHKLAMAAGTEPLTARTWRQGLPAKPTPLMLPPFPKLQPVHPSYEVQIPELPTRVSADLVARWQVPARVDLPPLRPPQTPTSESIERNPLAHR